MHVRCSALMVTLLLALSFLQENPADTAELKDSTRLERQPTQVRMRSIRRIGKHKGYSIDVRYPHFTGGSSTAIRKLNHEVEHVVDMNIPGSPLPPYCYGYRCDFEKHLLTPKFVSILLNFDNDTGGAGGDTFTVPLNAQIYPRFKLLKLRDVLGRKVNYAKLAELCVRDLNHEFGGGDRLKAGDLPPADFTNFALDKHGITFTLPEEPLKPNIGSPTWTADYKELERLISANSPIREIASKMKTRN